MQRIILELIRGIAIGAGGILPGISGASLAVVFGYYEEITSAVAHPVKNLKPFLLRRIVLVSGIVTGFVATTLVLGKIFADNPLPVIYLFMGFIAGTLPGIFRDARKSGAGLRELISFCATAGIMIVITVSGNGGTAHSLAAHDPLTTSCPAPGAGEGITGLWFISGAIIGTGSLLPGVSASFILIALGLYGPLLAAAEELSLIILAQVAIGAIAALMVLARFTGWLYRRFHGIVAFGVLGFTLGSLILVFPGFPALSGGAETVSLSEPIACAGLALAGFGLSLFLDRNGR